MTSIPSAPVVSDIVARLQAALPTSYTVYDAQGPTTPTDDVPYVVLYADPGMSDGSPMQLDRELTMQFSIRCVGETADQCRAGADRVRACLDGAVTTVAGRQVQSWQEQPIPMSRDDSLAPSVLFEQLLLFGLRSSL